MNFESCLDIFLREPPLHARFLNTLSYLEYIGFRKIVKSQEAAGVTAEILRHANEESRHALLLKKMSVKLGGPAYDSYAPRALFCGKEAEAYFQRLDESVLRELPAGLEPAAAARLCYVYVTWLVEERALEVYKLYVSKVSEALSPIRGLLAEEDKHLAEMEAVLSASGADSPARRARLKSLEQNLFTELVGAFGAELARAPRESVALAQ